MVLPEADPEEYEQVRNILTLEGLWQTFNGDEYDAWVFKVINVLKLQYLWHFIAKEDPIDPEKFNSLTKFEIERRQVVALCLMQNTIDYSLFHYIV